MKKYLKNKYVLWSMPSLVNIGICLSDLPTKRLDVNLNRNLEKKIYRQWNIFILNFWILKTIDQKLKNEMK